MVKSRSPDICNWTKVHFVLCVCDKNVAKSMRPESLDRCDFFVTAKLKSSRAKAVSSRTKNPWKCECEQFCLASSSLKLFKGACIPSASRESARLVVTDRRAGMTSLLATGRGHLHSQDALFLPRTPWSVFAVVLALRIRLGR